MVFLILYTFFVLPARIIIGFGGSDDESTDWLNPWTLRLLCDALCPHISRNSQIQTFLIDTRSDLIMDLLFCVDLALNFITSVSTPNGTIVDFAAISLLYLRSW